MFDGKKILLSAFSPEPGSESRALYDYLKAHGATDISTLYWGGEAVRKILPTDLKAIEIKDRSGAGDIDLSSYDLIFRHPTTRPDWLPYSTAVTSQTRWFFANCPAPIIAVTGTKGKGTTSTLIAKMLEAAGKTVHLLGNIGVPVLSKLDEIQTGDIVVFEISSFQLWDLETSPHLAVVLMIAPDHLDVHADLDEYVNAKANIVRYQKANDVVVHHPSNELTLKAVAGARSHKIPFMAQGEGATVQDGNIMIGEQMIISVKDVGLRGGHNLENICAALTAFWQYSQDRQAAAGVIAEFKGLEHRLEPVGTVDSVEYFNDSFSASVPAAVAAVKAFEEPKIMILGGSDKGADYKELAQAVAGAEIRKVLLIGQTGPAIAEALNAEQFENFELLGGEVSMGDIVSRARALSQPGDVVVLSPGCASFDMFRNYKDRGQQFKQAVHELL